MQTSRVLPLALLLGGCGHASVVAGPADAGEPVSDAAAQSPTDADAATAGADAGSDAATAAGTCPPDDGVAELRAAGLHLPFDDGVIEIRLRVYLRTDGTLDCATLFSSEEPGLDADCFAMVEGESWRPMTDADGNPTEGWITYLCRFEPRTPDAGAGAGAEDDAGS